MRQITIVRASSDAVVRLLKLSIDDVCVRVHLRVDRVHHQILNPRSLPPHFWHDMDGLVLRGADRKLSDHQPHRSTAIHEASRLLLEPVE